MNNEDFFDEASIECLKNAKQYIKDGEILYSFRSYGHALAMIILGNIELGKSAIYNLHSKNLIPKTTLPKPYSKYFQKREIEKFAAESWWIGLVLYSNIEEIIQNLIEVTEEVKINSSKDFGIELTQNGQKRIKKLMNKMIEENKKFQEIKKHKNMAFFVKLNQKKGMIDTPNLVKKSLVKEELKITKNNIVTAEPFLDFPLNEVQQKIAQMFLNSAFQSILPIKKEINQVITPKNIATI